MSDERFDRIEVTLKELVSGQEAVRAGMNQRLDEHGRHMRLLHDEALERIAAIGEFDGPSRAEFQQGLADLEERIGRRLDPLVLAVRHHAETIRQNTADIDELRSSQPPYTSAGAASSASGSRSGRNPPACMLHSRA